MKKDVLRGVKQYNASRKRRKNWQKVVMLVACVVVFCTTYALILPAITMEGQQCQIPEHTHTDECYTLKTTSTRQVLHCTYESLGVHQHTEDCYDDDGNLICGEEDFVAHTHDENCYDENGVLVCELPEIKPHTHDESCYTLPEPHVHDESCYQRERGALICTESTEASEEETMQLICELPEDENHTHGEACYEKVPAAQPHVHTDECYEWEDVLVCEKSTEPDPNAQPILTCEEPEIIPHTHTEDCYDKDGNRICGQVELLVHQHTASCFDQVEEPLDTTVLTCTLPEDENHTHTERCYGQWELTCGMEEHTHTLACYANPEADVETAENWEQTFASAIGSGDWRKDTAAIAKTQLGYTESKENYIVAEDGETVKGYTRYGAWFGQPYGDWNTLFASFCLHYAGAEVMPQGETCQDLITALGECYVNPQEHTPQVGELVFLDSDGDGAADHVGILTEITENAAETAEEAVEGETVEPQAAERTLTVVEGDLPGEMGDAVREERYPEAFVVGYGAVPKATKPFTLTAQIEGGITVTVTGEDSSLPYPVEEITLTAVEVVDEESLAIRDELLGEKTQDSELHVLLDVTLRHGEEKIEPIGPVQVTFGGMDIQGLYPVVHHIDPEKQEAVDMDAKTDKNGDITMDTDHFSLWDVELYGTPNGIPINGALDLTKITNGGDYYLNADIEEYNGSLTFNGPTTLDLYGHSIKYGGTERFLVVNSGGNLTIKNSTPADNVIVSESKDKNNQNGHEASLTWNGDTPTLTYYVTRSEKNSTGTEETLEQHQVVFDGSTHGMIRNKNNANAIVHVSEGGTLNLEGGLLTNTHFRVIDNVGGTVNIKGGYVAGGDVANVDGEESWGGGIRNKNSGTTTMSGGVIAANRAKSGGGVSLDGGTFTMTGGYISGNKCSWDTTFGQNGDGKYGQGGGVFGNGATIKLSGDAYITNNRDEIHCDGNGSGCHGGGGVATTHSSTITMNGGFVTGNYAYEAGGGLYVGHADAGASTLSLSGGVIAANRSETSEGGGIRISKGTIGTIQSEGKVYITNNKCDSTYDWGGGGIFVQEGGTLNVTNTLITQNTAGGFGGGVGACPSGETLLVHTSGAAIFDNTAQGLEDHMSKGGNGKWADKEVARESPVFMNNGYQDYFCIRYPQGANSDISLVTGSMIGGGAAKWHGSCDDKVIDISKTGHAAAKYMFGLTADPKDTDKTAAVGAAHVIISGNYSHNHGGGIMTNGGLIIGSTTQIVTTTPSLDITGLKALFKDDVRQSDNLDYQIKLCDETGAEVGSVKADKLSGMFTISPNVQYEETGTYTYVLKEFNDGKSGVTYDDTEYTLQVVIKKETTRVMNIDFVSYYVDSVRVFKDGVELNGSAGSGSGSGSSDKVVLHFHNNANWNPVKIYTWVPSNGQKLSGEFPGSPATLESPGWYKYEVPIDKNTEFKFIFNNGSDQGKTDDMTKKSGYAEVWYYNERVYEDHQTDWPKADFGGGDTPTPGSDFTGTSNPDGSYTLALNGDTFTNRTTASLNLKIVKTDSTNENNLLGGATFRLKKSDGTYDKTVTTSGTGENAGVALFEGLAKNAEYWLWETQAPANYYKSGPWILTVDENGGAKLYDAKPAENDPNTLVKVRENDTGTSLGSTGTDPIVLEATISDQPMGYELPATGGTGTTWYTLGGLLITVVAAGLLVYNKKSRRGGVAFL